MPEITPIIAGAGCLICGTLGYFAAILMTAGKCRDAERRAWREAERLQRARAIQDNRDSMRLF